MRTRKPIICFLITACITGLYVVTYFCFVERVADFATMEVVRKGGSYPTNPRNLVQVTAAGYSPSYSSFPAELFWPVHYLDQRLIRPQFWLGTRTEEPVRVVY